MTPAQALADVESKFIVHDEIGQPIMSYGTDDTAHDTGARDASKAPSGDAYITVMSGGLKAAGQPTPVLFADEDRAWRWWYYAVLDYAETIAPEAEWSSLHLYWRHRPEWSVDEYMSTNQAAVLQRGDPLITYRLGSVYSRLVISKEGP